MIKSVHIAALGLAAFGTAAMASPDSVGGTAGNSASAAAGVSAAAAAPKAAQPKKYCANVIPDTGSRMSKRHCKTKAEWAEEGVDITAKK